MRLISAIVLVCLIGCTEEPPEVTDVQETVEELAVITTEEIDLSAIATYSDNGRIQAIVEIPAGTNEKIEYDPDMGQFEVTRTVMYMPYPANYGFIPGTFMDPDSGGDGDAMDVIILAPNQKTGTVLEVVVIGALELLDNGEVDNKIVAVPADPILNLMDVWTLNDLPMEVMIQLENWFGNYKGAGAIEFVGWQKEDAALQSVHYYMQ